LLVLALALGSALCSVAAVSQAHLEWNYFERETDEAFGDMLRLFQSRVSEVVAELYQDIQDRKVISFGVALARDQLLRMGRLLEDSPELRIQRQELASAEREKEEIAASLRLELASAALALRERAAELEASEAPPLQSLAQPDTAPDSGHDPDAVAEALSPAHDLHSSASGQRVSSKRPLSTGHHPHALTVRAVTFSNH
jgi:hypothetical protein